MTIFNEPIGTWISLAAILISISTLLLSLRKQKYDERTALANKIADIKATYGDGIRVIDEILDQNDALEKLLHETPVDTSVHIESIQNVRSGITDLKNKMERMYNDLGYRSTRTTDPVVLYAVSIESEDIKKQLEKERDDIRTLTLGLETTLSKNKKTIESIRRKTKRKSKSK
jgi:hypothetical protein